MVTMYRIIISTLQTLRAQSFITLIIFVFYCFCLVIRSLSVISVHLSPCLLLLSLPHLSQFLCLCFCQFPLNPSIILYTPLFFCFYYCFHLFPSPFLPFCLFPIFFCSLWFLLFSYFFFSFCLFSGLKRGVCSQINHFPEDADYDQDAAEYLLRE